MFHFFGKLYFIFRKWYTILLFVLSEYIGINIEIYIYIYTYINYSFLPHIFVVNLWVCLFYHNVASDNSEGGLLCLSWVFKHLLKQMAYLSVAIPSGSSSMLLLSWRQLTVCLLDLSLSEMLKSKATHWGSVSNGVWQEWATLSLFTIYLIFYYCCCCCY